MKSFFKRIFIFNTPYSGLVISFFFLSIVFYLISSSTNISLLKLVSYIYLLSFAISVIILIPKPVNTNNIKTNPLKEYECSEIESIRCKIISKIRWSLHTINIRKIYLTINNNRTNLILIIGGIFFIFISYQLTFQYNSAFSYNQKINLIIGIGCLVIFPYIRKHSKKGLSTPQNIIRDLYVLGYWLILICGIILVLSFLNIIFVERYVSKGIIFLTLIIAIETFIRGLLGLIRKDINAEKYLSLNMLFYGDNPIDSVVLFIEEIYGVNIKSTHELRLAKKVLLIIFAVIGIGAWLSTSLIVIEITQIGVIERFGKAIMDRPLKSGLHLVYPWPVDKVHKIDVSRINSVTIGVEAEKEGASLLWTKQHAKEEYSLLLGGGRDLITFNGKLEYKVNDPFDYLYDSQNPEEIIKQIAYRVLLKETVDKSLDEVLSESARTLVKRITEEITKEINSQEIGIEVIGFRLQNIHPPTDLARDYQKIISAQIDMKTKIVDAETYNIREVGTAKIEAMNEENSALIEKINKVTKAKGEAEEFNKMREGYDINPALYRHRKRLEKMDEVLKDLNKYIIDDRINMSDKNIWIDFRPDNEE